MLFRKLQTTGFVEQPGYSCGIGEASFQFLVGIAEKKPGAGQASDEAGALWQECKILVPNPLVLKGADAKTTVPVVPACIVAVLGNDSAFEQVNGAA